MLIAQNIIMKSREEVQELKAQWRRDPCWDIFDTEGFEEYREELKSYQEECEFVWDQMRVRDLEIKAGKMGIPNNLVLAAYIEKLEFRISQLSEKIQN